MSFSVTYKNQETPEEETVTASLSLTLQCQITSGCEIPEDYLFADCWKTETESPIGESWPHNRRGVKAQTCKDTESDNSFKVSSFPFYFLMKKQNIGTRSSAVAKQHTPLLLLEHRFTLFEVIAHSVCKKLFFLSRLFLPFSELEFNSWKMSGLQCSNCCKPCLTGKEG